MNGKCVSLGAMLFEKGISEGVGNWYSGIRLHGELTWGLSALKEGLKTSGYKVILPCLQDWPSPGPAWQAIEIPLEISMQTAEFQDGRRRQALGRWLFRAKADSAPADSQAEMCLRLCINLEELSAEFVDKSGNRLPGAAQPKSFFECQPVKATAHSKRARRRNVTNFKLEIQDNRLDPTASQPPNFKTFPLREEQLRSLHWMQQREVDTELFDLTMHRFRIDPFDPDQPLDASGIHSKHSTQLGWQLELRHRQCFVLRGGILGDAMGYGKTATTIGLINSDVLGAASFHIPAESEPYFFKAGATLVLVPTNLMQQWLEEIAKFTGGCQKVLAISTVTQLKALTVRDISSADVVMCTYRLLYSPVYRRRLQELAGDCSQLSAAEAARVTVDVQSLRRNTKRFRDCPAALGWLQSSEQKTDSPPRQKQRHVPGEASDPNLLKFPALEQIWWRRVVFDEFHELEAIQDTAQFESLKSICADCRWGLTGTPPTRDLAQVATLATLLHLPRIPCKDDCDYNAELAQQMAQHFLDRFVRRNTSEEITTVPLKEHIVTVEQTAEERAIYLQASHDLSEAAGGPLEITGESQGVEKLIKLCSHFAAYSSIAAGAADSADASAECQRILSTKQQQVKRAEKQLQAWACRLELAIRQDGQMEVEARCELSREILQRPRAAECNEHERGPSEGPAPEGDGVYLTTPQTNSDMPSAAAFAAASLSEAANMSTEDLQKKAQNMGNDCSTETLKGRVVSAMEALSSARRSAQFFERTLAAARGKASAEQRSCSICLEEDLPEEVLSITTCAHVFHTSCLQDCVRHFGNCPVCRHKLSSKNDVTRLTAELTAPAEGRRARGTRTGIEHQPLEKQAGSKLAALASHLKKLHQSGEKALLFCQWEDLKRRVSHALEAFGVSHFQLTGSVYQRAEVLRRFKEEAGPNAKTVLLLSLEHAASGTNLTAANHVIFIHPMYATSAERAVAYEAQAIARCRRLGQEKQEVHCWRFVTRGTIEEAITAAHTSDLWKTHLKQS